MGFLYACHCLNISLHLESTPLSSPRMNTIGSSLSPECTLSRSILGAGGVLKVLDCLVSNSSVSIEEQQWTVFVCHNCKLTVYLLSEKNEILVNTSLLNDEQAEELRNSPNYSSIFNIVIPKDSDIMIPLEDEPSSADIIENILKETLNMKRKEMEDRIRQVEREEREKFTKFEKQGIRQAQSLLKKLWTLSNNSDTTPNSTSSTPSSTPNLTPSNTPSPSVQKDVKGSQNQTSELPKTKQTGVEPTSVNQTKLDVSLGVFDFDDDFGDQKELSVEENEEDEDLNAYEQEKKRVTQVRPMMIPASLPVQIPKQMQSRASHTTPTEEEFVEPPHIYSRTIQASTYIDYDTRPTRKKINLI